MGFWKDLAWSAGALCERQTLVLSRRLDGPVPLGLELGVRAHLVLCRHCRRCARQFRVLDAALRALSEEAGGMPAGVRDRIAAKLRTVN